MNEDERKARRDRALEHYLARQEAADAAKAAATPVKPSATPTPAAAAAGWYPHQTMADTLRYWDGQEWTTHTAPAAAIAPSSPIRPAAGNDWTRRIVVALTLLLVIGLLWFFFGYNSAESKAVRACHDYVELRLKAPTTAEFSSESARKEADGDDWAVTGIVDSENGFGAKVRNVFTCEVSDDFIVTDSHFSEDDD